MTDTVRNVDVRLYQVAQEYWGNYILYRLAEAFGYEPDPAGNIVADPDMIVDQAVLLIKDNVEAP